MTITSPEELLGIQEIGRISGIILRRMCDYAQAGMNTKEIDKYGESLLKEFGVRSAPMLVYKFPGSTCISVNNDAAHGVPYENIVLKEGDLINIDVSAELNGYYADNGCSFIIGKDINNYTPLVETSKKILFDVIGLIKHGVRISEVGRFIDMEAIKCGYTTIKNLAGHGIGRTLHEYPGHILCYFDGTNNRTFTKDSVVAIETFISTGANYVYDKGDGWTMATQDGSFVAQHEHTILITDDKPIILTDSNEIWK